MTTRSSRARRVPADPSGPLLGGATYHYADAFEIELGVPDARTAEQFARSALDNAPPFVRVMMRVTQRYLLGFRLGPRAAPDHIQGWRIVRNERTVIQLEVIGVLGRAVVVGQQLDPRKRRLTTYNFYSRPKLGRFIWAIAGPMHRRIAAYLLERAATTPVPAPSQQAD